MKTLILLFSVLFTTMSFAQVPNYVPANGLVGWWPFNGNANDESGNGNNGTVNGATMTTDRNGNVNQAYSFDGNDFIQTPNQNLSGSVSFSGWYKMSNFNTPHNDMFYVSNQSPTNDIFSTNICFGFRSYQGQYGHSTYFSSPLTGYYPTNNLPTTNVWHHIACVVENGSYVKMYLDNVLIYSNTNVITNSSQLSLPLLFGGAGTTSYYYYLGQLDDIGIWNRALTDCEIQNLYTSTNPTNTTTATACNSYTWNGETYTQSGVYTGTTTNCVTQSLNLTITPTPAPTGLSCWQTATLNTITCAWVVSGTQPTQPSGLACYQTATFNIATCSWDVTGTQPVQPTLACYETASFNTATCAWVISGPQAPQKMSYQAVIRNSNDSLLISTPVGMRISLVQGTPTGTVVFSETQTATTNSNGLVSLQIGMGTVVTGTFACIDWAAGPYYVKTETDLAGGTNYTIISSNELLSVPYALFSANGPTGPQGPIGLTGPQGIQGPQGIAGTNGNDGATGPQGPQGSSVSGGPVFVTPEMVYQIYSEYGFNNSVVSVDFDTLIGQHVNAVILYYENSCTSGMSTSPVQCRVDALTNAITYEIIDNYHASYGNTPYPYGSNSGQIMLPIGPNGIVTFSNDTSRSNLKVQIIGYYN